MAKSKNNNVSYRRLAEKLGVSHNAVKLALKGEKGVSEQTRNMVLKLACELNYHFFPKTDTISVAAYSAPGSPYHAVAEKIVGWLNDNGIHTNLFETPDPPQNLNTSAIILLFGTDNIHPDATQNRTDGPTLINFFAPSNTTEADTFLWEAVEGPQSSLLKKPDKFLRLEHLLMIRRRIRTLTRHPETEYWTCIFHTSSACKSAIPFKGTLLPEPATPQVPVRIADIAKATKTTPATVSMAIQGNKRISDKTLKHVINTAWKMGFRPMHAKKNKSIIIFDQWVLNRPHVFARFYSTLNTLSNDGDNFSISHITSTEANFIKRCINNLRPDGVVLFYDRQDMLKATNSIVGPPVCPAVSMLSPACRYGMDSVMEDHYNSVRHLIDYFISKGARRFAYIGTKYHTGTAFHERWDAFCSILKTKGLYHSEKWSRLFTENEIKPLASSRPEDFSPRLYKHLQECEKSTDPRPDAILCYNDNYALALSLGLRKIGIENIHISGWDNLELLARAQSPVTTVDLDIETLARTTINLINMRIEYPYAPLQTIKINSRLILPRP